jgi:hypothetical protein
MRVLGLSEIGRRAQHVVRDDPRFIDILAVEESAGLLLYEVAYADPDAAWFERYVVWAKLAAIDDESYRLEHLALSGSWQELDVVGTLEHCISAIADNKYHLFFV